ncbi:MULTISPECIES: anti-sigma factor domain-containing protein [unclassified Kribbella]|uniref:anti-sigma factor domain-containing protein n=1 Tax=unclassified Kribbella TaxID=2644121 RepID=UPI0033CB53B1
MTHLDEELLAQWALEGTAPDPDAAAHLSTCPDCQTTLAELRELAAEATSAPHLASPPPALWDRIAADLHLTTPSTPTPTTPPEAPTTPTPDRTAPPATTASTPEPTTPAAPARRGYGRRTLVLAASVAAVLGVGIGLGAAAVLDRDEEAPPPVAVVQLEPLPGKTGGGTADLIQDGNELKVSVTGLDASTGYYELWLINADGERMVSLGVLDPAQGGTFRIPDNLTSEGYRIVDVSLEPNDGNPAHSRDSVVRGTLPA